MAVLVDEVVVELAVDVELDAEDVLVWDALVEPRLSVR